MRQDRQGFTLLELMMVVVIIGILATIAVPQYLKTRERARMSEAYSALAQVRSAQGRHFVEHNAYAATIGELDVNPGADAFMGTAVFDYACTAAVPADDFDCTATRKALPALGGTGCIAAYKLHIDEAGTITGGGCASAL